MLGELVNEQDSVLHVLTDWLVVPHSSDCLVNAW